MPDPPLVSKGRETSARPGIANGAYHQACDRADRLRSRRDAEGNGSFNDMAAMAASRTGEVVHKRIADD